MRVSPYLPAALRTSAGRLDFELSETARNLIVRGAHLLIEKPVVLTLPEAQQLLSLARAARTILLPGLSYRFCSYLHNFARRIAALYRTGARSELGSGACGQGAGQGWR